MTQKEPKGVVLLITLLLIGAVAIAVFVILHQSTLNAIVLADEERKAWEVREAAFGCLEEVFIQLQGDPLWSEASVVTNAATCTVAMQTPLPSQRIILVTLTESGITRGVRATITLTPLIVTGIDETLTI